MARATAECVCLLVVVMASCCCHRVGAAGSLLNGRVPWGAGDGVELVMNVMCGVIVGKLGAKVCGGVRGDVVGCCCLSKLWLKQKKEKLG